MNILLIIAGIILIIIGSVGLVRQSEAPETASAESHSPQPTPRQVEPVATPTATPSMPSHDEIVQQLNIEAEKQQVYINLFSTAFYEDDKDEWQGLATKGKPFNYFIENGASDYWQVTKCASEDAAAWAMVQALRLPPNQKPRHKDERKRVERKELVISPESAGRGHR